MTGSNLSEIVTKNSITIGCSLFVISYYLLFVIRDLVLFAIRYTLQIFLGFFITQNKAFVYITQKKKHYNPNLLDLKTQTQNRFWV